MINTLSLSVVRYARLATWTPQMLFFLLVLCASAGLVQAQSLLDVERSRSGSAAYFNYAESGDVTIFVKVWGSVRYPGLYEVPHGMKMSTLFSLAGGPAFAERRVRNKRTVKVQLTRANDQGADIIYQTFMENEILVSDEDPVLQEGDVLSAESTLRQGFGWRDVLPVANAVALIALAIERISNAN